MRKFYLSLGLSFFIGCGGSSSTSTTSQNTVEILDENKSEVVEEVTTKSTEILDPLFYQQWTINKDVDFYLENSIISTAHINVQDILLNYTGKGVKVAIIDDGFDVNHTEISKNIIATVSVDSNGNILGSDVSQKTGEYHGTAVAGIIGSASNDVGIRGIAPDAELILIQMPESFTESGAIELFKQAVDLGADVINCSWGTGDVGDIVKDYIETISTTRRDGKGTIVVFASGNNDGNIGNDEAAISTVIGVGATDRENLRTTYSDYGSALDIVAPGGEYLGVSTIDPLGQEGASNDEFIRYNETKDGQAKAFVGTSAASPIVAGVIALGLEKDNNLTRQNIQDILKYSTNTIGSFTPYLDDMISSSSSTPTITGMLGTTGHSEIKVRLISKETSKVYGGYSIVTGENSTFSSTVTDNLPEGDYSIEIINLDSTRIWATDEEYTVDYFGETKSDSSKRKSDFYGYGKIDLDKFMGNI